MKNVWFSYRALKKWNGLNERGEVLSVLWTGAGGETACVDSSNYDSESDRTVCDRLWSPLDGLADGRLRPSSRGDHVHQPACTQHQNMDLICRRWTLRDVIHEPHPQEGAVHSCHRNH